MDEAEECGKKNGSTYINNKSRAKRRILHHECKESVSTSFSEQFYCHHRCFVVDVSTSLHCIFAFRKHAILTGSSVGTEIVLFNDSNTIKTFTCGLHTRS
jgi:hypothetical protein